MAEKKVKQYNHWHRYDSDEKKFYNVDGYSISYKIYYDGNADLFELKPSTWIMSNFPVLVLKDLKMKTVVVLYWSFHIQSTNFMKRKTYKNL